MWDLSFSLFPAPSGERWLSLAGMGPIQTLPKLQLCRNQELDAVCHLGEVAAVWLLPVPSPAALVPSSEPSRALEEQESSSQS